MSNKSNPNGSNQYQFDPRQKLCWEKYANPKSDTFGNARQSAISAGYEPDYADQITSSFWFKEKIRRLNMLSKAEDVLEKTLEMQAVSEEGRVDPAVQRIKADVAKFVASTLGKSEGYSTRTEMTGADGERLIPMTGEQREEVERALRDL
jgi:hypothetical protein